MKPVPSAPGYLVNELGEVWRNGRRLSPVAHSNGYFRVKLSIQNKQRDAYIHRLVCEAYHGPCPAGLQCRHLDGNRTNNTPGNLCWSDKAANEADKVRHGTVTKGERHGLSKLTAEIVLEARRRASAGEMVEAIALDMGLPYRGLLDAVSGRRWKHLPGVPKLIKGAQRKQMAARLASRAP